MTNENLEEQDSLNPEGEEEALDSKESPQEEEGEDKFKELADNYKVRAEKAEKRLKEMETSKEEEPKKDFNLSQMDFITLAKADVHEEDIDEVVDYAKYKKIPVKEALSSSVIKNYLAEQKEYRATADATTTGNKRTGGKARSGGELLNDANTGKLPETDEEMAELVNARFQSKIKR